MATAGRYFALAYIAVTALFLGYLGTTWAFFPADHMERLGVTATSIPAINTLKSIMGTALLGVTGACLLFLFDQEKWFRTLSLLIAIMIVVRVTSLAIDGFHPRMAVYAALEVGILIAVYAGVKLKPQSA